MIIIHLRFDGGSAEEEHDIAHIASSIVARLMAGFFLCASEAAEETRIERAARLKTRSGEENQHGTARVAGHFFS